MASPYSLIPSACFLCLMNRYLSQISNHLIFPSVESKATRDGYGEGLVLAGERDSRVVALCADLTESTRTEPFAQKFPERFVEIGVAEQLLATVASGLANYGKIPFMASYAAFSPGRNWEQIRTTIALNDVPVKIVGAHAGLTVGPDGATHQQLEDLALMRALPNMIVVYPCDALEARKATWALAFNGKPSYLRLAREKTPLFTTEATPFEIGQAQVFREGSDVTVIACGPLVYEALKAAEQVQSLKFRAQDGIDREISVEVINCPTLKPIDGETILESVKKTGKVVTVEEHQINGGLGGAVAEFLSENFPVRIKRIGMPDHFGESGEPEELLKKWKLDKDGIKEAVLAMVK